MVAPKTKTASCQTCGETPARLYFDGYRCTACAPTEQQVREHAINRAATNDAREARLREIAIPPRLRRETR